MAVYDRVTKDGTTKFLADGVNLAASAETTSTAVYAHAKGEYFTLAGELYVATAAIAAGGTITDGTNCRKATLAEEVRFRTKVSGALDARSNYENNFINYGYDVPFDENTTGSSGASAFSLRMERNGSVVKLNGSAGTSGTALRINLNSVDHFYAGQNSSLSATPIQLVNGHKYRLRQHQIGGTASGDGQTSSISPAFAEVSSYGRIAGTPPVYEENGDVIVDYTYDSTAFPNGIRLLIFVARASGNTLTNWEAEYTLEDLTAGGSLLTRVKRLEAIINYLDIDEQIDLSDLEG